MHKFSVGLYLIIGIIAMPALASAAPASGFALMEQSGTGLGQAFAGATTGLGDGSSVYYNAAAMTKIDGTVTSVNGHIIAPSAKFSNTGSTLSPALGGIPTSGGNGSDGGETGFVPNIYAVHSLSEDTKIGLGINSPYGLATEYSDDWVGRYHGIKSELLTVNISPTIAHRVNEWLSVGGGIDIMYADADLTNAVDFGTIGFSALGPATATSLGLLPQSADGKGKLVGNDISPGFNVGFLVELPSDTEIGVQYRSRVNLDVSGHAFFDVPANAAPLQAGGAFVNSSARAGITLPDSFGIGVKQVVSEEWSLFGEADWTHWTHFKDLRVDFDSTQPDSVTNEGWNNSWRFALGTSYEPCEDWTLRAGYAYQKTPIADAEHRTPRIPDQDRHWLTGGIGYDITDDLTFDLSYAHLFVDDASTNIVGSTGDNLKGDWDLSVDIVSAGFTWRL